MNYHLEKKIYEGKKFFVNEITNQENQEKYILKSLFKRGMDDIKTIKALKKEYNLLKKINSEFIIKAYDWLEDEENCSILLENINAFSVKEKLISEPFTINDFYKFSISIIKGLIDIHRNNIIHCDINPNNIIINSDGLLKIIDFDLAYYQDRIDNNESNIDFKGTLFYISPEQTGRTGKEIDQRSDLYSLGVTFYEMLTSKLPFFHNDNLEIIHDHLVRDPIPPKKINSDIPEVLSNIILKLMAKNPSDRYQSADGLLFDLEKSRIESHFKLGENDYSTRLEIPNKLYGRNDEINILKNALFNIQQGQFETIMVTGYSGTGKTSFVSSIKGFLTENKGFYISGKFDLLQKNIPYYAFSQAFDQFCRILLTETKERQEYWKNRILEAVGRLGQILIDISPRIEMIIGNQPSLIEVAGDESRQRFNFVLSNFLKAISTKENPLILFIDDLQWADFASIDLLQNIIEEKIHNNFLLLGSYRDNEVDATHPLIITLNQIQRSNISILTIKIKNLSEENLLELLEDTFHSNRKINNHSIRELCKTIYSKTFGNPFYTLQMIKNLHNEGVIYLDFNTGLWNWNIRLINEQNQTDNVLEILSKRIFTLPLEVVNILKLASCIGNQFSLSSLSVVSQADRLQVVNYLDLAIFEQLIISNDEYSYEFIHDKIQQSIYNMIREEEKKSVHLSIGKLLDQEYKKGEVTGESNKNLYNLVNHLNKGRELINDDVEILRLAKLNVEAGKNARIATAYKLAFNYLEVALEILSNDGWKNNFELTLKLHNELVRTNYLLREFENINNSVEAILYHSNSLDDKILAYEYKLLSLIAQNLSLEAIDLMVQIFNQIGLDFERNPSQELTFKVINQFQEQFINKNFSNIKKLDTTRDKKVKLVSRLFYSGGAAYIWAGQVELPYAVCNILIFILQFGLSLELPYILSLYALIRLIMGDFIGAYDIGQLSLEIGNQGINNDHIQARAKSIAYIYTFGQKHHFKQVSKKLIDNFKLTVNVGDFEYSAYMLTNNLSSMCVTDTDLSEIKVQAEKAYELVSQFKQRLLLAYIIIVIKYTSSFIGDKINPEILDVDPKEIFIGHQAGTVKLISWMMYNKKVILAYHFEDNDNLINYLVNGEEQGTNLNIPMTYIVSEELFFYPLSYFRLYCLSEKDDEKAVYMEKALKAKETLKEWADFGPVNFLHKYYLLEAELYRIHGDKEKAEEYYNKSIETAYENEYVQEAGLANELAARFFIEIGKDKLASPYLIEAVNCYSKWGAKAKVNYIKSKYSKYLRIYTSGSFSSGTSSSSFEVISSSLDIQSILKASQAISGEIVLTKLITNLLKIVMENAGAEKCFLILKKEDAFFIEGEAHVQPESFSVLKSIPYENFSSISAEVVNYVIQTHEIIVLGEAYKDNRFQNSKYLKNNQTKSLLTIPLVNQGQLNALIYMENNKTTDVFTEDRIELIKLLSSQIAISIENATLYQTLEDKVNKRTKELHESNIELEDTLKHLKETQNQLVQSEKMASLGQLIAGIAHELNTPLGAIQASTDNISTSLENMSTSFRELIRTLTKDDKLNEMFLDLFYKSKHAIADTNEYTSSERRNIKRRLEEYFESNSIKEDIEFSILFTYLKINEGLDRYLEVMNSEKSLFVLESLKDFISLYKNRQTIMQSIEKASKIVFALRKFAHRDYTGELKETDLIDSIETVLTLYHNRFKKNIEIVKKYNPIPKVVCSSEEIQQVWTNIIHNALQSMELNGKLTIETVNLSNKVKITFQDTGSGIPEEIQNRIFDPFFTTKPEGEGSGLGLSIVKDIIEKHQGEIKINSKTGEGTIVTIILNTYNSEKI